MAIVKVCSETVESSAIPTTATVLSAVAFYAAMQARARVRITLYHRPACGRARSLSPLPARRTTGRTDGHPTIDCAPRRRWHHCHDAPYTSRNSRKQYRVRQRRQNLARRRRASRTLVRRRPTSHIHTRAHTNGTHTNERSPGSPPPRLPLPPDTAAAVPTATAPAAPSLNVAAAVRCTGTPAETCSSVAVTGRPAVSVQYFVRRAVFTVRSRVCGGFISLSNCYTET